MTSTKQQQLTIAEELFSEMDDNHYWATCRYSNDNVFPCPYDLYKVHDWWIKWNELSVVKNEGDEVEKFKGNEYENDYKRPDTQDLETQDEHFYMMDGIFNDEDKLEYYEKRRIALQEINDEDDDEEDNKVFVKKFETLTDIINLLKEHIKEEKEKLENDYSRHLRIEMGQDVSDSEEEPPITEDKTKCLCNDNPCMCDMLVWNNDGCEPWCFENSTIDTVEEDKCICSVGGCIKPTTFDEEEPPIREDSFKFNTKCVCSKEGNNDYPCVCDIHEDEVAELERETRKYNKD